MADPRGRICGAWTEPTGLLGRPPCIPPRPSRTPRLRRQAGSALPARDLPSPASADRTTAAYRHGNDHETVVNPMPVDRVVLVSGSAGVGGGWSWADGGC